MNPPIYEFASKYALECPSRFHMPGHKGQLFGGAEFLDITEITGLDSLYSGTGVISESEKNASSIFGANTYYSAEGSSLCIRSMLYLVNLWAKEKGESPHILAARNVHKSFLSGVALLDMDVSWLPCEQKASYLASTVTPEGLENYLSEHECPHALYLTSPDYLGNMVDISAISGVCKKYGIFLLVDNAHGAYLHFLKQSMHPIDLGADMCCDSAHKTLPALTGSAYLHIAHTAPKVWCERAKDGMALFGSTSPSFLILESLDLLNPYLKKDYRRELRRFLPLVETVKNALVDTGYTLVGNEPLKLTLATKSYGYLGDELAALLAGAGMYCEFSDPDYLVLMFTPQNSQEELEELQTFLCRLEKRAPILDMPPALTTPRKVCSIREATLGNTEVIPAKDSLGRTLASATVACPPAVPIVMCGEEIDAGALAAFAYYGVSDVEVIK